MVKIGGNSYECGWCGEIIEHVKKTAGERRYFGPGAHHNHLSRGKGRVTGALRCPKCGRNVSQKEAR